MTETMTGRCACGAVRFEAEIDSDEAYLCHCRMCQRATGSVSIAFKKRQFVDYIFHFLTRPPGLDTAVSLPAEHQNG